MSTENATPDTLIGAITYFSDVNIATLFLASLRWPDGIRCPHCDGRECPYVASRRIWQCKGCRKQFSVKVGSIFEDSPIPLSKWLPAMWMLVNCKNGVSSYEIARDLGVTQKTAWFMLHRLRLAVHAKSFDKFGGDVEIDETYIGGKARNMHPAKKRRVVKNMPFGGKVAVMGLLERHSKGSRVTTVAIGEQMKGRFKKHAMQGLVRERVEKGSVVYTDSLKSYLGLSLEYVHNVIDHAETYAEGSVHTNGLENFWSLLKRALKGTYISVEPFHLFRYLDEQVYRFNNRKWSDAARFVWALRHAFDKRVTYTALTGKELPETC